MNVSLLSLLRIPYQYLQHYSFKIQQIWRETFGPFFKQLHETFTQNCCFRWPVSTTLSNETSVKTDELANKTLQPQAPTQPPVTEKTILQLQLPLDPKTTVKTLDNGFTYYIRDNNYPSKETATLCLAVRAGSTDELEHERGLAHFLEHMLFQDTENFGKADITRFLESQGVAFGADQNAHTSFNETVYKFNIPLNDPELLDKALYILREMATKAKITESAVEEERNVILDEINLRESAESRFAKEEIALILEGTPYPERMPIGLEKVIRECTADDIRDFYKRTYLPQNMALVAVGDFDQKQVDALIQKHFGDIPSSTEPAIQHEFRPIKRSEAQFLCYDDPEAEASFLDIRYPLKTEFSTQEFTVEHVRQGIINSFYHTMLNRRLKEIISNCDDSSFFYAKGRKEEYIDNIYYYTLTLAAHDGEIPEAYKRILMELKKVQEHGFLPEEFEHAQKNYQNLLEHLESEKDHSSNSELAEMYISHFLDGSPYLDTNKLIALKKKLLESIKLEHINIWCKILTSNKAPIISTFVPTTLKDTVSPEILKSIAEEVDLESVTAHVDTVVDRALLRQTPKPGKIVDTVVFAKTGITKLTLENGMHVYIRPSAHSEDTIMLYASTLGGELSMPDEKRAAADMGMALFAKSGMAGLTPAQVDKLLVGKTVGRRINIQNYATTLLTTSAKKDLDTAFQLVYNTYADRTFRPEAFVALKKTMLSLEKYQNNDPKHIFHTAENALCTQNHIRFQPITAEEYEKAKYEDSVAFLNNQFANPGNFNLVITGNIDVETIKPFLEQYLAGIPGERTIRDFASFNYPKYEYPAGIVVKEVEAGIANTSQTSFSFPAPANDIKESRQFGTWTAGLFERHLLDRLRFIKAENYTAYCDYALTTIPGQEKSDPSSMELGVSGLPEKIREINKIVLQEIEKVQKEGFTKEEVDSYISQVKETYRKAMDLDSFWMFRIDSNAHWGRDIDAMVDDYQQMLDKFDAKVAQEYMQKLFPLDHYVQVTLLPKNSTEEQKLDN